MSKGKHIETFRVVTEPDTEKNARIALETAKKIASGTRARLRKLEPESLKDDDWVVEVPILPMHPSER